MKLVNEPGGHLLEKTKFTWKTFGASLNGEVREFIPNEHLAWDAKRAGILADHAWLIIQATNGCKVITEETQYGLLCRLGKLFMPVRMDKYHPIWLEGLKRKAENE